MLNRLTNTEEELLQMIAHGDEQAFTELYNRHWKKLYTFLARMTKSPQVAEELMYDIFTKLWTGRELITDIHNMDAFLSKVAYNKALNFFRYTARQQKLQDVIAQSMNHPHVHTEEPFTEYEFKVLLQEAIRQLSPQRKQVFILSREQGLTHEEIAKALQLSPNTVKKTMSNALEAIRDFLQKNGVKSSVILYYYISH